MNAYHSNHVCLALLVIASLTLAMAILLFLSPPSLQATPLLQYRYVAPSGNDTTNDCTSSITPCQTVQHAFDMAQDGDKILVAAGAYTGIMTQYLPAWSGYVTATVIITKNIAALLGGYSSDFGTRDAGLNETTLNAAASPGDFVVFITGTNIVLDGFSITGSNGSRSRYGAGIRIVGGSPTISHNRVYGNSAKRGPGIYISNGSLPTVLDNRIFSNTAQEAAGGMEVLSSGGSIQNNLIYSNTAQSWAGGGMEIAVYAWTTVISNSIYGNTADTGGGIAVNWHSTTTIAANEIVSNTTTDWAGGGIYVGDYSAVTIDKNTIAGNRAEGGGGIAINNGSSVTATNNLIASSKALTHTWSGDGIYVSAGTVESDARIINNTIVSSDAEAIQANKGTVLVRNNIVHGNGGGIQNYLSGATVSSDHNDFWNNGWNYTNVTAGTGDIYVDPQFVDVSLDDYHIRFGSPAMNTGTNDSAPLYDKDGVSRPQMGRVDMGAYEIIGSSLYLPAILR